MTSKVFWVYLFYYFVTYGQETEQVTSVAVSKPQLLCIMYILVNTILVFLHATVFLLTLTFTSVRITITQSETFPSTLLCEAKVNPIQDGLFRGCSRMGGGGGLFAHLPKIRHTNPTMMKLGSYTLPKEDP